MSNKRNIWLHAHNLLRTGRQIINSNLRPLNLTSAEGNILLHLWTQKTDMRQDQLVEQLDVSKPAISRTLNSLVKNGYITRQQDPQDKRAHLVSMTNKTIVIGPALEHAYNQVYTLALNGISPNDLELFFDLLSQISKNMTDSQDKIINEDI